MYTHIFTGNNKARTRQSHAYGCRDMKTNAYVEHASSFPMDVIYCLEGRVAAVKLTKNPTVLQFLGRRFNSEYNKLYPKYTKIQLL